MQVFSSARGVTTFAPGFDPVGTVDLGETFRVETVDCYDGQIASEQTLRPDVDMARFNRATGPVAVRGVGVGDWLRVRIERVDVTGPGVMALTPGLGVLGDAVRDSTTRLLDVREGHAWLTSSVAVPLRPMVGVVGVATAGETVSTSVPGEHGANLDTRMLEAGASFVVRSNQPGAGLAVGDLHAAMGDGELGGTGIEIAGSVTLSVHRMTAHTGRWPLVVSDGGVGVLASRASLDDAVHDAFAEGVQLMARWHDLGWADAYRLTSVVSDLRVSQVVNPRKTARLAIPARWCPPEYLVD